VRRCWFSHGVRAFLVVSEGWVGVELGIHLRFLRWRER
jgi:hypothetical protein